MKYSVYVWVVCCLLVGEIYAYLPVRFSGRLINTATTHTTGPNIGYNPNTATTSGRIIPQHPSTHRSPISTTSLFGIPKLFRWLVDLYPLVVDSVGNGISSNSMKIDNFYLDMNGIIHACTHSNNDGLIDFNEEDMFIRIFKYTDRLYKLVRPKKMMYLAVDGVAPRAKMNQQRSRRFRSSKEREALIAEFVAKEGKMPDNESFDSNCITPGTEFMHRLGIAFNKWIEYQMTHDPFWQQQGATVYFSGPDVPGEGEHKIMDKIRAQQASGIAIGSEVHCMYGLDADLIMLSLASHEPYFMLLREKISKKSTQKDALSYQPEDFEVLEVSVLRSMLKVFFKPIEELADTTVDGKKLPSFSIERVIDDFVFMCYFIGNDFLPCIPHLDISDGALNMMMSVYKDMFPTLGGYLTDKGQLHFPRIELFIQEISRREPLYFQQRAIEDKERPFATPEYRDHYYKMKFQLEPEDIEGKRKIVKSYLEGLAWVLTYYYHGCGSWTWYYPYLYAPLGSDLRNLSDISVGFDKGRPFTPLLQLLSVLPPQSANFLPSSYADLMINPSSNLSPYYPRDFTVDANGKKAPWECVVQIPFINEKMLIDTVNTIDHAKELTPKQQMINRGGKEHAYKPSDFKESFQKNAGKKQMINSDVKGTWGSALDDQYIAATRQYSPGSSRSGGGNGGGGSGYRGGNGGGRGGQSSGRSPR